MRVVFLADPVQRLKPKADSTLAMLRETLRRGHEALWVVPENFEFRENGIRVHAHPCLICGPDELPQLGSPVWAGLHETDAVLIRKDPPFDGHYLRLCWLLALEEPRLTLFNRPSRLLRYHEKLVPLEARAQGFLEADDLIPTYLGSLAGAKDFIRERGSSQVVTKPFLGFGGSGVRLYSGDEFLKSESGAAEEDLVVQPFEPSIRKRGDRRVFFLGGKQIGDFVRMPAEGGFVSNLAQGGKAVSMTLEPQEQAALERLGRFLAHAGIDLAGADLIGRKISEVNITSPTGIRSIMALEGRDISGMILDYLENLVRTSRPDQSRSGR
jgi:glutathione synthase